MPPCDDRSCPYVAELATIQAELRHIRERLEESETRSARMEQTLDHLAETEQRMIGGYRLFRTLIALLAAIATILAIPWLGRMAGN